MFVVFPLTKPAFHAKMLSCGWLMVDIIPAAILTCGESVITKRFDRIIFDLSFCYPIWVSAPIDN